MIQKSYNNKNALYIVPTPIGNLDDITKRALDILNIVDYIFAEDTRTSSVLLNHFNIKKKMIPCHKFNEETSRNKALEILKNGKNIALITDQGTPLISDPGYLTVQKIIESGYNVIALPGATAFVPALNMSGISSDKFLFYGFLNSKSSLAKKELEELKNVNYSIIIYEAPHRLEKTLNLISEILGNRKISISREITKLHEEIFRGNVLEAIEVMKNKKGEFVIVIEGNSNKLDKKISNIQEEVKLLVDLGLSETNAIKYLSKVNGISKNKIYNEYHRGVK